MTQDQQNAHWIPFEQAMRDGNGEAAERALASAVELEPDQGTAFYRISTIAYRTGQMEMSVGSGIRACKPPPAALETRLDLAMHLMLLGEGEAARELCIGLPEDAAAGLHLRAARQLTSLEEFVSAEAALASAARQGMSDGELARFRARVHAALGRLPEAEAEFRRALQERRMAELDPAYLSRLGKSSPQHNHVDALRAALAECEPGSPHVVGYAFALFGEYHDLGEYAQAWEMLQLGCAAKRAALRYDAEEDAALMARLAQSPAHPPATSSPSPEDPVPIFILGLPRAGSTLVERILGNHSQVESTGEPRDFLVQLRLMCGLPGMEPLDRPLLERMHGVDAGELGRRYLSHIRWRLGGRRYFIDKTPLNYLYIGLIRAALPQAKIIHAYREPMDACFSIYKFVFPWLYPFSYDQRELGRYYLHYRRVMAHWHQLHPGAILDVAHETLLEDPEGQVRRILDFCGLADEPGLTELRRNKAPAATGSNAQIRDGMTTRYRGQWRPYEAGLAPLRGVLATGGLAE